MKVRISEGTFAGSVGTLDTEPVTIYCFVNNECEWPLVCLSPETCPSEQVITQMEKRGFFLAAEETQRIIIENSHNNPMILYTCIVLYEELTPEHL